MKKRIIALLLFAMMLTVCLASCKSGGGKGDQTTAQKTVSIIENGSTGYTLVRADECSKNLIKSFSNLAQVITEATGAEIDVTTDYLGRGETVPEGTCEILVGATNRPESTRVLSELGAGEYAIKMVGKRLVIIGYNDDITQGAIELFIKTVLGYDSTTGKYAAANVVMPENYSVKELFVNPDASSEADAEFMNASLMYTLVEGKVSCNTTNCDEEYLYENDSSLNGAYRYADGKQSFTYCFDLTGKCEPKYTFSICQTYKIEVTETPKMDSSWVTVADYYVENGNQECRDVSNTTSIEVDPYKYKIYKKLYVRISDGYPLSAWGGAVSSFTFSYYEQYNKGDEVCGLNDEQIAIIKNLSTKQDASGSDAYEIHADGGMIYNPISREKADELNKYDSAEYYSGKIVNGNLIMSYRIPKNVTAYDAVPIYYTIEKTGSVAGPVYVDASAFEDADKENGNIYYDLNIPGRIDVTYDYLGYVGGSDQLSNRPVVGVDGASSSTGKKYPEYNVTDLRYSGTIQQTNYTWFKFRYTNTGNTVLDGDGNGTFCFEPILYVKEGNSWKEAGGIENLYNRLDDALYPGESGEMWVCFNLSAGEYKIVINGLNRNETSNPDTHWGVTIWGGECYTSSSFEFTVANSNTITAPNPMKKGSTGAPGRDKWLHSYEEFMSSYDAWLQPSNSEMQGVMYVQCAPWTNQIVLKLINGSADTIKGVSIPVNVETDSIKIELNKDNNNYVVLDDGTRFPAIEAQSMADMRYNMQLSPYAADTVIGMLKEMQDLGINLVNTTGAFEYDDSFGTAPRGNIDACWFSLDVMRLLGLKVQGWISYPYASAGNVSQANQLYGTKILDGSFGSAGLAQGSALCAKWQFNRWGDNYWVANGNIIPLDVEDTRGWMRIDFNARASISAESKQNFHAFLYEMYGTIDSLNSAWGTSYKTFNEIDPEEGTTDDHGYRSFKNKKITFGEWSKPLADYDAFRTLERANDYQMILDNLKDTLPTAKISLRTEGANWLAIVDPDTQNAHYCHVYYSQRRNAMIPEIIIASGTVAYQSDYVTLPYTPSEVSELTATSVASGIIPAQLPQFNRMRDIAVNSKYGNNFAYEYNLTGKATKGTYINTVCSVYEWFVATYENGGIPGILWSDFLCDGYATSTQKKEIAFYTQKLKEAIATPEGQEWAKNFTQDTSALNSSEGLYSFDASYVQGLIDAYNAASAK